MNARQIEEMLRNVTWEDDTHAFINYQRECRGRPFTNDELRKSASAHLRQRFFEHEHLARACDTVWRLVATRVGVGRRDGQPTTDRAVTIRRKPLARVYQFPAAPAEGEALVVPMEVAVEAKHDYEGSELVTTVIGDGRARAVVEMLVQEGVL